MNRNKTARQHNFAVLPQVQVPRSLFNMRQTRIMAFDASDIIPIMCEEVLPGDTWQHTERYMARLATPIAPAVDDLMIDTYYFFIPNRITTDRSPGSIPENQWEGLITGSLENTIPTLAPPLVSTKYTIPVGSVLDHFGIPPGQYTAAPKVTALPIWAYFEIYNQFFRDQNLIPTWVYPSDYSTDYTTTEITYENEEGTQHWDCMPLRACKRSDYITRALPFAQKGPAVTLPLGGTAPVLPITAGTPGGIGAPTWTKILTGSGADGGNVGKIYGDSFGAFTPSLTTELAGGSAGTEGYLGWNNPNLYTDLADATAITINALRLAAISQQMLERDARGGSRYIENLLGHWGVRSPDYRLDRPEYLGGSSNMVTVNPIAQTAAYDAQPDDSASPVGNLGAEMHASSNKRTFTYGATEHGYIIGLACVRATPTYQQGTRRHWIARQGRFSFYDPLFANLGEQEVLTNEVYTPLNFAPANQSWGFQEQGAEYRYTPNEITGVMRSTAPAPLDWWHYAEEFEGEPALNHEFILDKTKETLARSLAVGPEQWSAQIIFNVLHDSRVARLMPAYAIPGIDKF